MTQAAAGLVIRPAGPADADHMLRIGDAADLLFAAHGFPQIPDLPPTSPAACRDLLAENLSWLALVDGLPAGFAIAGEAAGQYWLKELAVDPAFGRRGIGTRLLATVVDDARTAGRHAVVLSTFRDVPFNRPFYARHGFAEVDAESAAPEVVAQFLREVPAGIDPATRLVMRRIL